MSQILPSTCPHDCPSVCALDIERRDDGTMGKVRGSSRIGYTAGTLCVKVSRYAERFHHPDRLGFPLLRTGPKGSGQFTRIGWDEALDRVAEGLLAAERKHGPEAVWPYFYAGTMGYVQRDGIERLRHVKRYSRQHSTFCVALSDTGWRAGYGKRWGVSPVEAGEHADLWLIWGTNPVNTHVNMMNHVSKARKRGAKVIVVDVYKTGTAEIADIHLAPKPGTDGALACGIAHVLFAEGYADQAYLAQFADLPYERLAEHFASRTPEWAEGICGIPAERIREVARLYGQARASYLRVGYGFTRQKNGSAAMHAVSCLPVITGAWQHQGGGALYSMGDIYGLDKTLIEGLDALDPSVRILDQSRIGPVLAGDRRDLGDGPPVTALFIQNTNPAIVAPESALVRQGFMRDDLFTVVHEQFMTDTAKLADIVLPATMFVEHDDLYTASAHANIQVTRKLFEPFRECRSNHLVLAEIARRVGAEHRGFAMTEWELVDDMLQRSGYPRAQEILDRGGYDVLAERYDGHFRNGFPTPDGRFRFAPPWHELGERHQTMPKLPDHQQAIEETDTEHPFRLVAAPARQFLNSSFTEMASGRAREVRPTALLHPDTMAALALADGDPVRVGNRRGVVTVHAKARPDQHPGTVVIEGIWPKDGFADGECVNTLISAEPGFPNGGGAFHDTAVWVRAAKS
ncbi:MAG TPA: molybdopterin-dependent oxidoreductase [Geminicoccus sp.]|uniref:molybdopterin-containing oxidoreductase family protein n=1 Tax=Geminicoccus sp. TaxID=2024832 RepID=UPI002B537D31|nr:molybdopterin-dependent oxidoreductase [Geminicoccus sp.]HWL68288.1 molybdopterin-dependent oxidoreductase [Geminicoccus sp.]